MGHEKYHPIQVCVYFPLIAVGKSTVVIPGPISCRDSPVLQSLGGGDVKDFSRVYK